MSNFIASMRAWRDKCEAAAYLIPGPQLVDGWHNGFTLPMVSGVAGTKTVVCGIWAGNNGNFLERVATADPDALAALPELYIEEILPSPPADPDRQPCAEFARSFGHSEWQQCSRDAYAYLPVPDPAEVPADPPSGTVYEYELFNHLGDLPNTGTKVGALYRQLHAGPPKQWFEHWILWPSYAPPRDKSNPAKTVRLAIRGGPSAKSLADFIRAHNEPDSRYALLEYTWQ